MVKKLFFGREKEIGIVLIISIIVSSNGLLFFLQNAIEVDLRRTTFEQQRDLQLQSTKEIAEHRVRCYFGAIYVEWFGKFAIFAARRIRK